LHDSANRAPLVSGCKLAQSSPDGFIAAIGTANKKSTGGIR
jgi:hypothetical protein